MKEKRIRRPAWRPLLAVLPRHSQVGVGVGADGGISICVGKHRHGASARISPKQATLLAGQILQAVRLSSALKGHRRAR